MRNLYLGIFWFLGAVILVLVVLATSNTLVMAVMERMREIGTLRAIGTSRAQIAAIVLLEALWLGLLGGALGCLLGVAATAGDQRLAPADAAAARRRRPDRPRSWRWCPRRSPAPWR